MSSAWTTALELRQLIASRDVRAEDVAREALDRIDRLDGSINAFLDVMADRALADAREVDTRLDDGESIDRIGPLAGIPVAIKDNICLKWGRTTCGSRMLSEYESPYNATAAQRLIESGAVIVGKTNLDEFAMGSSCEHSHFGCTNNPWDTTRVPGGSSGGSAAAVVAGMVPIALGSDTGGSVRQPAALCGAVGLKPTYGRISRYGLVAFASSLDQIGPMTRSVADAALALNAISGHDPLDSTSSMRPAEDFTADLDTPLNGLVLGVPTLARSSGNHPAVVRALDDAIALYEKLGATLIEVELPHASHGIAAYYIVAPAEASSNLARYDGIRYGHRAEPQPGEDLESLYSRSRAEGFGPEVQRRIMLGTHVLSSGYYDAYYNTALKVRRRIKEDYDAVFSPEGNARPACHALLLPSSPGPAFRRGSKLDDPMALYLEDFYTVGANLAGLPGISLPAGFAEEDGKRLPVGVQLIGPAWSEHTLLRAARMYEAATDWHTQHPDPPEAARTGRVAG